MAADPLRARESLRRLFEGGRLLLHPQPEGFYVAQGRIDVMAFLTLRFDRTSSETSKARTLPSQNPGSYERLDHLWSSHGCAGPQLDFPVQQIHGVADVWVPFEESIAVGWG